MRGKRDKHRTLSGQRFTIVYRKDRGCWSLDVKIRGHARVRETLDVTDGAAAAREGSRRVDEILHAVATKDHPTLARVAAEFLDSRRWEAKAESYKVKVKLHIEKHILPALGVDTRIGDVDGDMLRGFRNHLERGKLSSRTRNRVLVSLRQLLKFADESKGYIHTPPLPRNFPESLEQGAEKWNLESPATVEGVIALLEPQMQPLFLYLANTGLRVGTALKTRAEWIEWKNRIVRYPSSVMKGRRAHSVDLSPEAYAALLRCFNGVEATGETRAFAYTYSKARFHWEAARDEAGMPGFRIHDIRHCYTSWLLDSNTPVHTVRDMVGHRSIAVTQLYAHSTDDARRTAVTRVSIGQKPEAKGVEEKPVSPSSGTEVGTELGTT